MAREVAWRGGVALRWSKDGYRERWCSDLISTNRTTCTTASWCSDLTLRAKLLRRDWRHANASEQSLAVEWRGDSLTISDLDRWFNLVTISNDTHFGLFLYEASRLTTVRSQFILDLFDLFVSSSFLSVLLF
ncbi:hypothetical protein PybrP1_005952 [[Pythium] brassicae (nom. inval.)]|nr:hypothetical protein PybrP1_005952 [[Pythium] brassicae (nom. inval.)]